AAWTELFDGETVNGWTSRGDGRWVVEDGYITTTPRTGGGFLVTTEDFEDFRLQVEFWADTAANGGVFVGVPDTGEINSTNSFEINIFDAHDLWPTGSISELHRHDDPQTVGRWSTLDITVQGDHMMVSLDGEQTADVRGSRGPTGHIALQHHLGDGVIRYRNIRLIRF
ncbi:MAG: 3-keto-disaccharide hydrolase, partial [Longimicrobiales bacterium]